MTTLGTIPVTQIPMNFVDTAVYNLTPGRYMLKTGPGFLGAISITTAGTGSILVEDSENAGGGNNGILSIPCSEAGVHKIGVPFFNFLNLSVSGTGCVFNVAYS